MNKQDNSQERVVYIEENNFFLREILIATGKFFEDPDTDYEWLITTAEDARHYNYFNVSTATETDRAYYWEQIEKKLSV